MEILTPIDFWIPRTKKELVGWLFWFYDGKYNKSEIRKKNVKSWYLRLRYSGAIKLS